MTSAQGQPQGNRTLGVVLGVVSGIAVTAVTWVLLVPSSGVTATPESPSPSASRTPESPQASEQPSESASPTPSQTPSPSASATPEVPEGIVTSLPSGSWVTVLKSLPKEVVTPQNALEQAASLGNDQHKTVVLDTNAFDKLKPGYWAVVVPGQTSRAESNAVCDALGIGLGNKCYPREV